MTAPGFCKACQSPLVREINKRLARGDAYPTIVDWCATKDFRITRQKLADHKKHITDPRQTLVDNAKANPVIRDVSTEEYLKTVMAIAHQRMQEDPDSIGISHGLKAAQILEGRKANQTNVLLILARASRRPLLETAQEELIDGEYTVIEEKPLGITDSD